jgi:hypothetical protein
MPYPRSYLRLTTITQEGVGEYPFSSCQVAQLACIVLCSQLNMKIHL